MEIIKGNKIMFTIYVENQEKSRDFYSILLRKEPILDVPGMTEFALAENTSLGIMPSDGIVKLLENKIAHPNTMKDIPRCELYLFVDNVDECYDKAVSLGGKGISKGKVRNWGDYVAYCADFDGNIIAFAKNTV